MTDDLSDPVWVPHRTYRDEPGSDELLSEKAKDTIARKDDLAQAKVVEEERRTSAQHRGPG